MFFTILLAACASTDRVDEVLQPVQEELAPAETPAPPVPNESYGRLQQTLSKIGVEPIGLEYEATAFHELLIKIFSDPRMHKRKVKTVFSGEKMAYDKKAESLTIGGNSKEAEIFSFVAKEVPKRR